MKIYENTIFFIQNRCLKWVLGVSKGPKAPTSDALRISFRFQLPQRQVTREAWPSITARQLLATRSHSRSVVSSEQVTQSISSKSSHVLRELKGA